MKKKISSITIIGSSSGRNAGDAALLSGIMDSIDQACGRRLVYEIPSYRPDFIHSSYENRVRAVSMLPWDGTVGMLGLPTFNSVRRTDLSIIYDAMLFDRKLWNPLTNYMPAARYLLPFAKKRGKLVGLFNCGLGPVDTPLGRKILCEIGEMADFITLRDEDSLNLLREVGVKNENVLVTADAALNVTPAPKERIDEIMRELGLEAANEILAINVNAYLNTWTGLSQKALTKEEFAATFASALDTVRKSLSLPVLFVCTQHHDVEITQAIMMRMRVPGRTVVCSNTRYSHYEIRGVFERVSMLFGMRLHANILCSAGLTPISALAFQKKVESYYSLLGISDRILSFENFNSENLAAHILRCWEERETARQKIAERMPHLKRKALKAAEVIALIDEGVSPAEAVRRVSSGEDVIARVANT
jgi:polysaccharide pyruvyl transferase WcaK-like protein